MACTKTGYPSQDLAEGKVARIAILSVNDPLGAPIPHRAYKCPYCGLWHLTCKSKKQWRRNVQKRNKIEASSRERHIEKIAEFWAKRRGWKFKPE